MRDYSFFGVVALLIVLSVIVLGSIAPKLFPLYFVYIFLALAAFAIFSFLDFDAWAIFYKHFYIVSVFLLILPLLIGQISRGATRSIPIGPFTIQPAEIVKPFLLLFSAKFIFAKEVSVKRFLQLIILLAVPVLLILIQPSLGVAALFMAGFFGVILASPIDKKIIMLFIILSIVSLPITWHFLAPYQRLRVSSFLFPGRDIYGAGYNSLQSMIAVGSGKFFGRGLGQGVQTQLAFLPERQTDFIFASTAEELGMVGGILLIGGLIFVLYKIIKVTETSASPVARAFAGGVFLTLFFQVFVHIGMNMGLLPITGVPLPLVSSGGSSLVATMIMLAMVVGAKKKL